MERLRTFGNSRSLTNVPKFGDDVVHLAEKSLAVPSRVLCHEGRGQLCQSLLARYPCPMPDLTVAEQSESSEVCLSAGMRHVPDKIFQSVTQTVRQLERVHVAVQHSVRRAARLGIDV